MGVTRIEVSPEALLPAAPRLATGENPVWDAAARRWWCIDIPAGRVLAADEGFAHWRSWTLPHAIGCLVLQADGRPAVAGVDTLLALDLHEDGTLAATPLEAVPHPRAGMRCNDGRCDRQGRWVFSTMVGDITQADSSGRWWRWDAQGLAQLGDAPCVVPNGSAFSPDGRVLYTSDTHPTTRRLWRQVYDPATGTAGAREPFTALAPEAGRPDGATVDADGCLWVCGLDSSAVRRYTPDGRLDLVLQVPMKKPTMCAFGGADGRTLLVTSLSRGPLDLADDPHGGRLLTCRPGPQGLPEPCLAVT